MCIRFVLAKQEHCDLLFQWINDAAVRNNSFHTGPIAYEEHVDWFRRKLYSDQCLLYICYHGEEAVGQIRIDIDGDIGFINYSVSKIRRGKGYGTMMLMDIVDVIQLEKRNIHKLIGRVKYSNISSQRAFEKATYDFTASEAYIEYYKVL